MTDDRRSRHALTDGTKHEPAPRRPTPSYASPTLQVWYHSAGFLQDPRFVAAYAFGMGGAEEFLRRLGAPPGVRHEWPVLVSCWAAAHASHLQGDFVECGTNTGIMAMAICRYLDFNELDKSFYLFDTFCGIPREQISEREQEASRSEMSAAVYRDCYESTRENFAEFSRVKLVRGIVPHSLPTAGIERVCFLSIDMNIAYPEVAALEYFWDKLVAGAPVVLDDYGKSKFREQKRAMDEIARRKGVTILDLPTGQGLLLKPPH